MCTQTTTSNAIVGHILVIDPHTNNCFEKQVSMTESEAEHALELFVSKTTNGNMTVSEFIQYPVTISSTLWASMAGALNTENKTGIDQTDSIQSLCEALVAVNGAGNYVFDISGFTYIPQKVENDQWDFLIERLSKTHEGGPYVDAFISILPQPLPTFNVHSSNTLLH